MPLYLAPFISAITGTLAWIARAIIPGLMSTMFIAVLTRVGLFVVYLIAVNAAVDVLLDHASTYLSGLPGDLISLMTLTGLINAMNIIASAYLFKLTLRIDSVKLLASKAS